MQRLLFLLLSLIIISNTTAAQNKKEAKLATAIEAFRLAMVNADKTILEKLSHDSLSYGHSSGMVESKASFVENIVNGNSDFITIDLTGQTIYVSGKTAIVRHRLNATIKDKGKEPGKLIISVLSVWLNEKKDWKMLARQAVKIQ